MKNAVTANLVKTRSSNIASSSLADWYLDQALYEANGEYFYISQEYNTTGTSFEAPEFPYTKQFQKGSGSHFSSVYRAASALLGYNWSEEGIAFRETHKTWRTLTAFENKEWNKVDDHLKPSLKDLGVALARTNKTIDFEGQKLCVYHTGTETTIAVLEYPSGSKFIKAISSDSRGFMRWSDQHSVNVSKDGWKIKIFI